MLKQDDDDDEDNFDDINWTEMYAHVWHLYTATMPYPIFKFRMRPENFFPEH